MSKAINDFQQTAVQRNLTWKILLPFCTAVGLGVFWLLFSSRQNKFNDYERLLAFRKSCIEILGHRSGAILAMNPRNGLVLALVNEKLAVQQSTRPGSIFKIVSAMSLLKNGVVSPTGQYFCPGNVEIRGKIYHCWLREGHAEQNLIQALANSCNAYFFQAAGEMSAEQLKSAARQFLLGECTGINAAGEDCGQVPEWFSPEEKINFAVGHARALAVTPIQTLRLIAAIANGGYFYRPFYPASSNEMKRFQPELAGMIHFGDEWRVIKEGLRQSVSYGTSAAAKLPHVAVAGKTGTVSEYFGYQTAAWFAGFAPFENPEIA
ncbi:MAG: penicillin-binding transpeptidase domain-containing protein, partial [candidate division KSB1 bacterium]|nr:penicillin-binding transpeptidase domain-containing protein [candidate division KSB1 bacterium]